MDENKTKIPKDKKLMDLGKLSTSGAIIIVAILVVGAIFFGIKSANKIKIKNKLKTQTTTQQQTNSAVNISKVNLKGEPFIGNPNAPVVIAYWSDYQCPFCKRFNDDAIRQIVKNYVNNGKVKIVFKDFQFLGPDSQIAGLAGRAVWEIAPAKFYIWHKAMYNAQDAENSGWGNKADILALTKSLGIDSVKVGQLMDSKASQYQREMNADRKEADSMGIKGTPAIIIGHNSLIGAQPYAVVKQLIDQQLQAK